MRDKDLRTIAFLGMHLLVLPLLIGLLALLNVVLGPTRIPSLIKTLIGFIAFGVLYVGMGYAVASWVAKRIDNTPTEISPEDKTNNNRPY